MKAILIRVAILLFLRWLKKDKNMLPNSLLDRIFEAQGRIGLINALEHGSTKNDINEIIMDIENEPVSNVFSDLIEGK